jgi:hypothetical protein
MHDVDRKPVPRLSRRLGLCVARGGTLFGIAILAVASCQRFQDDPISRIDAPIADYLEYDACLDRGGRWLMHAHECVEDDGTKRPTGGSRSIEPPAEAL